MTLRDIGEDDLIARLVALVPRTPTAAEGPGDDCAVVDSGAERLELLKTDALVENVHFLPGADPRAVGWKAVARVVSDFAAMGGRPERFLVTVALPADTAVRWVEELYQGIGRCLEAFDAVLAGGETSRVPDGSAKVVSVAATGSVERGRVVLRSGARPGDVLFVTGLLGGSGRGRHLDFMPRVAEAGWLAESFGPSAMMDLSDGLAKDLPRMAAASGCGFEIDCGAVPAAEGCSVDEALGDGEDFELLFAIDPARSAALEIAWPARFPDLRLTRIGRMTAAGTGATLAGGWDHFRRT